jgi:hypothetical protein
VEYIDQVVTNYTKFNIPLETFVTDSQYMDKDKDFTLSNTYALADFQVNIWPNGTSHATNMTLRPRA